MKDLLRIEDYVKSLKRKQYSPNTILAYRSCVKKFFNFFGIRNPALLKGSRLRSRLGEYVRKNQLSLSKQKQMIGSVKFYYELLHNETINVHNLYMINNRTTLPDILSPQQIRSLLDAAEESRDKTLLCLAYASGCTANELSRLQLADLDLRKMQLRIRSTRKYENRHLLLPRKLVSMLRSYIKEYEVHRFLFPGKNDSQITRRNLQYLVARAGEEAAIKKEISLSMIRHSFATHLAEKGTDPKVIQEILGLKNLSSVNVYIRLARGKSPKVANPLDDLDF